MYIVPNLFHMMTRLPQPFPCVIVFFVPPMHKARTKSEPAPTPAKEQQLGHGDSSASASSSAEAQAATLIYFSYTAVFSPH